MNRKLLILIGSIVGVVVIILSIVLPVTLTRSRKVTYVSPKCPDGVAHPRVDCLPDKRSEEHTEATCKSRGCCWSANSYPVPSCVFPYNYGYSNTKWKSKTYAYKWLDLVKLNTRQSLSNAEILNLETKIEYQTDERIHLKIYPRKNFRNKVHRWQVPSGIKSEFVYRPLYDIQIQEVPFGIKIIRKNTSRVIFDTTQSSLIFSDQFLQLTTTLSSSNLYGIGEHSKVSLRHDMNYKSWPLFAAQNHPNNNRSDLNLYSQFPLYLNIEPDGNSHLVVFHNSNPTEFYLTPFPSVTYRSLGGIFDIYIFLGPTPIQAIEQFQQTFGLPKLQPYWSMGLQIGSNNYDSMQALQSFTNNFTNSLPYDSIFIGTEYLRNSSMFTLNSSFRGINEFVSKMKHQHRHTIFMFIPGIVNSSSSYPYKDGTPNNKVWIYENFFSTPFIGSLLGQKVVYPDFTLPKTNEWWKDALNRYLIKDEVIRLDGIFFDYLSPLNEDTSVACQNNKWNSPAHKPISFKRDLYTNTLCMDARHANTKHFNIHGLYSHLAIEQTSKALEPVIVNRSFIMSRHGFIGTGQYSIKYVGDFSPTWDGLKRFIVSIIEMGMFGFPMNGGDACGKYGDALNNMDLCEAWIKLSGLSPFMRVMVNNLNKNEFLTSRLYQVLNSTLHLRYSLVPYFYTQMYHATMYGTLAIRPLAFEYPQDLNTYDIDTQFLWGSKLMVTASIKPESSTRTYLPRGLWYDYYTGKKNADSNENGMYQDNQVSFNTTTLHIRGGSVLIKQEARSTLTQSKMGFIDILIALDANFSASGDFYVDDGFRRSSPYKENYHRLTQFKVQRNKDYGIIEIERKLGKYNTRLAYRDVYIYGLNSKPERMTVNENSYPVDSSRTHWNEQYRVYKVNLQTDLQRKVLIDNEYLSLRWSGGFDKNQRTIFSTKIP